MVTISTLDAVTNLLLLALMYNEYKVAMDTEIFNAIYAFNDDVTYIKFSYTKQNVYCMHIGRKDNKQQCFFTTVKVIEMKYSILHQKQALVVQALQENLRLPSNVDLANVIEYNILGTCQYNQCDIG